MLDNNQQVAGGGAQQAPSMLDNVNAQDFGVAPAQPAPQQPHPTPNPMPPVQQMQPAPTPQNTQRLTQSSPQQSVAPYKDPATTHSAPAIQAPSASAHPSGPVAPPATPTTDNTTADNMLTDDETKMGQDDYLGAIADSTNSGSDNSTPADADKLAGMKKQALDHLEPLVEHLEQDANEEFRTTMMMIQANDNHTLLEKALAAAKKITDDKERAQAMLDIVNEINYFSQNSQDN